MIDPFLMTIIIAVVTGVVILVVLVWLIRTHLKLKYEYQVLANVIHAYDNDIASLCAARQTVDKHITTTDEQISILCAKVSDLYATRQTVDKRIAATDEQISILCTKISAYQHNEPSTNPYSLVIQKVRSGANVSELMQNSGLSQDEATLLIRLHGSSSVL